MIDIKTILAPTDFSKNSEPAMQYAFELARQYNADLKLIHVVDDVGVYAMEMEMGAYIDSGNDLVESERRAFQRMEELALPEDIQTRVTRHTMIGAPSAGICRFANENNVDVIVISTHGRTGLNRLLMGSVAEHVARRAPCPVLTVRPSGNQFVESEEQAESAAS